MANNKFVINMDSESLDPEDVERLVQKMVKNSCEFDVYFQNQSVSHYWCRYPDEKAEVVYDLMKGIAYYSPDKKLIYLHSNINNYGIYAMDNLLTDSEMWDDQEDF